MGRHSARRARRLRGTLVPGVLVALTALAPGPAAGQWSEILALEQGDSLRLRLPGALRVDASMRGLRADTLLLHVVGLESDWPVSAYDLATLERYGERTRQQGLRNGAVLGAVVGLFVGGLAGATLEVLGAEEADDAGLDVIRGTMHWAGVGAGVGGFVGAVRGSRAPGWGWVGMSVPSR